MIQLVLQSKTVLSASCAVFNYQHLKLLELAFGLVVERDFKINKKKKKLTSVAGNQTLILETIL